VSVCRAGCEAELVDAAYLCGACAELWRSSSEMERCHVMAMDDSVSVDEHERRSDVAFVDFCTRMRLERQNGAKS